MYQVLKVARAGGAVYTIAPVGDLSKVCRVHWTMMKAQVQAESLNVPRSNAVEEDVPPDGDSLGEEELCVLRPENPQAYRLLPPSPVGRDQLPPPPLVPQHCRP